MKIAKYFLIAPAGLLSAAVFLWAWFGYPDDRRLAPFPMETLRPQHQYEQLAYSLFLSESPGQHSLDREAFSHHLDKLRDEDATGPWLQTRSGRFRNPWQVYLSAGSHPERLEGRDAILIPVGESFSFKPSVQGRSRLEAAALSIGGQNTLELAADNQIFKAWKIQKKQAGRPEGNFWYQKIGRYLSPDAPVPGGIWTALSASYQAAKGHQLSLRCRGKKGYCIVSEPKIWQHSVETKANLLFILVDTMRDDALDDAKSAPFMHHFARNAIRFRNTLASGNMTSPSTNALLSCRKPSDLGPLAFSYSLGQQEKDDYYRQNKASFPHLFTRAGWETAMIGNISVISEIMGAAIDHGFSQQIAVEQPGYDTAAISREGIRWLSQNGHKPFFLYLHFHAPHAPYRAPFRDILSVFPDSSVFSSLPDIFRWLYKGEILQTDRYVRQVISALKALKLDETTTVVLTADHGDHHELRYFGENEAGPAFSGTYFDHGATLFSDEIRVPLVIKPAGNPASLVVDQTVSGLDTGPTMLEMSGISAPPWCTGRSLVPYFNKNSAPEGSGQLHSRTLGFEGFKRRGIFFDNRYKYIRQYSPVEKRIYPPGEYRGRMVNYFAEELLYDLRNDPGEQNNLSQKAPQLRLRAKEVYQDYYQSEAIWELVITNPGREKLDITADNSEFFRADKSDQKPSVVLRNGKIRITPEIRERYLWRSPVSPVSLPRILVGGKEVPVRMTGMHLPLSLEAMARLSPENPDAGESPVPENKPAAWIRKAPGGNVHKRKIQAGNPTFDRLLQEWGYLNNNT